VRVVNTVTYAVCLEDGRHLHPGEVAEIADSERHRGQIAEGQLRLVASAPVALLKPQPAPPRPAAQSQEEDK
jgi:hypothetical protein